MSTTKRISKSKATRRVTPRKQKNASRRVGLWLPRTKVMK